MTVTLSKMGGTRIADLTTLPPVKINELVLIDPDGAARYFSIGDSSPANLAALTADGSIVICNSAPRLPLMFVSKLFGFSAGTLKQTFSMRIVLARYVNRAFYSVRRLDESGATVTNVGIYKTAWAAELGLRAVS